MRFCLYIMVVMCVVLSRGIYAQSEKIVIDSIAVLGNESTKEFIILNELTFGVGDAIDSTALKFNRDRVFSLGIFNRVDMSIDSSQKKILIIEVKESWYIWPIPFIELVDRDWDKISYGMDFYLKNFRGLNENLKLRASLGYNPGFRLIYDIPNLIRSSGIFSSFQAQSGLFNNPNEEATKTAGENFEVKHQSISASIGVRHDNFTWTAIAAGLNHFTYPDWIKINQVKDFSIPSLAVTYLYDRRNLTQLPTEGNYLLLGYAYKGFGINDFSYGKLNFDYRQYIPLIDNWTFKYRFYAEMNNGNTIPYHDYVFLGYAQKVRGYFSEKREGDVGLFSSIELSYPWIKDYNIELHIPYIPKKLQTYRTSLYSYLFLDAGNVRVKKSPFIGKETLIGIGAGLALAILPYRVSSIEFAFNDKGKLEFLLQLDVSF